jgi:hypothetical protein
MSNTQIAAFLSHAQVSDAAFERAAQTLYNETTGKVNLSAPDAAMVDSGRLSCVEVCTKTLGTKVWKWLEVSGRYYTDAYTMDNFGHMVKVVVTRVGKSITGVAILVGKDGKALPDMEEILGDGSHKTYATFLQRVWKGEVKAIAPKTSWERACFAIGVSFEKGTYRFVGYRDTLEHGLWDYLRHLNNFVEIGGMHVIEAAAKVAASSVGMKMSLGTESYAEIATTPLAVLAMYRKLTLGAQNLGCTPELAKIQISFIENDLGVTVSVASLKKDAAKKATFAPTVTAPVAPKTQTRARKTAGK